MNEIERARRITWLVLVSGFVALWTLIATTIGVALRNGPVDWWRVAPALAAAAGFTWLSLRIVSAVLDRRYPTRQVVVAAVLALVTAGLGGADAIGFGWAIVCWVSIATLQMPWRRAYLIGAGAWAAGVALYVLVPGLSLFAMELDLPPDGLLGLSLLFYGVFCSAQLVSNRIWVWIWALAVEAHQGREAHTRLALTEERLRLARDLHDLVGHQLSAIAVKTELAVRLSDVDAGSARSEMAEVNQLTRKALKDLRQAVRGYRELDLTAELNSVKGVLEAAGVRCEVRLPHREPPGTVAPVFAYAVREAVTNVLKHSTATFCEITIRLLDHEAELSVRNDGVARRQAVDLGSGLTGMRERLAAVGGRMTAGPAGDGRFLLTAVVSLAQDG
ncbi:sensor histidine kinase [Nonomuraea candida]|uniref:sensor histidine kinase n=1 Tax=Nonomuraea candida TaxID=359159 RepID=UPI0006935A59|nr:histidine kinase [Nonomuraea candida]